MGVVDYAQAAHRLEDVITVAVLKDELRGPEGWWGPVFVRNWSNPDAPSKRELEYMYHVTDKLRGFWDIGKGYA